MRCQRALYLAYAFTLLLLADTNDQGPAIRPTRLGNVVGGCSPFSLHSPTVPDTATLDRYARLHPALSILPLL